MSLASSLVALGDGRLPATFEGLRTHLPLDWIESCLEKKGVATFRRRKLPVENVVWLIVGMALFRDRPIPEIVRRLDLVLPGDDGQKREVAESAITPARDRLGEEPLQRLFGVTGERWTMESAERYRWRDLMLLGIDATTLRVADSAENRRTFENHCESNYPMIRLAMLMALRSRVALDCSFAGCRTGEASLAKELLASIPENSLTILDRYFYNFTIWDTIHSKDHPTRHWLVRTRDEIRGQWRVIERFGPGDELVEISVNAATLSKHPQLPSTLRLRVIRYRRAGFKTRTLMTSLLDPKRYPARELAELYHERWELELAYDEIKTQTLERRETIRSQSPDRVRQEIWGLMIAYNLVRREMEGMASKLDLPANRISFQTTLMMMRDLFCWAEVASPGKLPLMIAEMRLKLETFVLPPRRNRRYPRVRKMRLAKYGITKEKRTQRS